MQGLPPGQDMLVVRCDEVLAAAQNGHRLIGISTTINGGFVLRSVLDMVWGIVFEGSRLALCPSSNSVSYTVFFL